MRRPHPTLVQVALILVALLACNAGAGPRSDDTEAKRPEPVPPPDPVILAAEPAATAAQAQPVQEQDAPEISRSGGQTGGVVVLWPRIVLPQGSGRPDAATRGLAGKVQAHLAGLARATAASRPVDVRPEPERVCARKGCKAVAVGALLARAGGGCAVIVTISAPGKSAATLVPASPGRIILSASTVPFREPVERVVRIKDYASCDKLPADLGLKDADVKKALASALGT